MLAEILIPGFFGLILAVCLWKLGKSFAACLANYRYERRLYERLMAREEATDSHRDSPCADEEIYNWALPPENWK